MDSFDPHTNLGTTGIRVEDEPCPYDPDALGNPASSARAVDAHRGPHLERSASIRALYMEKDHAGGQVGGRTARLRHAQGLWDETLIVLMSDHGQPMGENEHGHGINAQSAVPGRMKGNSCTYL